MKKNKVKVLHLLSSNSLSGAENVVCTIIETFDDKFEMIYCSPSGRIKSVLENKKIPFYGLKKLSYFQVKKIIKEYHPDIIHAHDYKASCLAALFSNKAKIISHIHVNNKIMQSFNIKSLIYRLLCNNFNRIIWVSDSALNEYYLKKNVISKSSVIYNVVNQEQIIKKSNEYNTNCLYDLIFLGRLTYQKNPERLIEIIKGIKKHISNIKVAIVGDGLLLDNVHKLVIDNKLENNIDLLGFKSNPYPLLKCSKILIMTSRYEGTPMVALEAQALGKPIIATEVDGLKKIIKNNYNGFLSNENDLLIDMSLKLIENNNLYNDYSINSINNFKTVCDLKNYINNIRKIYEGIL